MKYSLKRLGRYHDALCAIRSDLTNKVYDQIIINVDFLLTSYSEYEEKAARWSMMVDEVVELINAIYSIRGLRGAGNSVSQILTSIHRVEAIIEFYTRILVESDNNYPALLSKEKFDYWKNALGSDASSDQLGRSNNTRTVYIVSDEYRDKLNTSIRVLKSELLLLRENLDEANATTKLQVSSSVQTTLSRYNLV